MKKKYRRPALLFLALAVLAGIVYPFDPSFSTGLFAGLGIAVLVYIIREFLPKRQS